MYCSYRGGFALHLSLVWFGLAKPEPGTRQVAPPGRHRVRASHSPYHKQPVDPVPGVKQELASPQYNSTERQTPWQGTKLATHQQPHAVAASV